MQYEPVMGVHQILWRYAFEELEFDFERRLSRGQSGAITQPENMRVHRHRRLTKGRVQHNVGCFASHSGESFQRFA